MDKIDIHVVVLILIALGTAANSVILSLLKMGFNKFSGELSELWEAITVMREKQAKLREEIPKEYLRVDGPGYKAIMDSLKRIEEHAAEVAKDLAEFRKGNGKVKQ